jgi:hypothetical protein
LVEEAGGVGVGDHILVDSQQRQMAEEAALVVVVSTPSDVQVAELEHRTALRDACEGRREGVGRGRSSVEPDRERAVITIPAPANISQCKNG